MPVPIGLVSRDTLITAADGICIRSELRYWLDAQGRDKLIVTPSEHTTSLSDMNDEMLVAFWKVGDHDCGLTHSLHPALVQTTLTPAIECKIGSKQRLCCSGRHRDA